MNNRFVFVVPYYNAADDISRTLYSVMAQSYRNWRAIFIDDLSTDDGPKVVEQVTRSSTFKEKFSLISNVEKHGEVRNTLKALDMVDDDEIICRLDGGDWLLENDLLWMLNQMYSKERCAAAWTAHRWGYTPQNISGPLKLNPGQTVYQHPWVTSHLKTFRGRQLRKVPHGNFLTDDGEYIMIACDQAVYLPMLHVSLLEGMELNFLPIVAYHYNIDLGNKNLFVSERAIKQKASAETIRARGFIT